MLTRTLGRSGIKVSGLGLGLLTGKFRADSQLPAEDTRGAGNSFLQHFFTADGHPNPDILAKLEAVRNILTSGGRTLAQGALAWIWARSPQTIPIPGFKTVQQVEENIGATRFGPLAPSEMAEIDRCLQGMQA